MNIKVFTLLIASLAAISMSLTSCKKNEIDYNKTIDEYAKELNKKCPKPLNDDISLKECVYSNATLNYRCGLSLENLQRMDPEATKNQIAESLKNDTDVDLINAIKSINGQIKYVYIAEDDSLEITINSSEL